MAYYKKTRNRTRRNDDQYGGNLNKYQAMEISPDKIMIQIIDILRGELFIMPLESVFEGAVLMLVILTRRRIENDTQWPSSKATRIKLLELTKMFYL